jgi:transcriptional regulator with XRE-family HTH domain
MSYEPRMLPEVKAMLEEEKGHWREIAEQAGVNYKAIANIMQGVSKEPGVSTGEKLHRCLLDRSAA